MKTIYDLAAMVKRFEGVELSLHWDGKRFHAKTASVHQHALTLADAIECVAEEYRRRANGIEPMRDDGKGKAGDCAVAPTVKSNKAITLSINLTPPPVPTQAQIQKALAQAFGNATSTGAAPTPAPQYPTCPQCGKYPDNVAAFNGTANCRSGHHWPLACPPGIIIKHDSGPVRIWDGFTWTTVTP